MTPDDAGQVTAESLVALFNDHRFTELVPRVLSTMKHAEIKAHRDHWLRLAARAVNTDLYTEGKREIVAFLFERSQSLLSAFPDQIVPDAMPDGPLMVALLVNGEKLPSRRTFERAIRPLRQRR